MMSHSQDLFSQSQTDEQREEEENSPTPVTLTERLNIQKKPSKCKNCQRDFDTEKGLKIHLRACKKQIQNHTRQPNASVPNANTPIAIAIEVDVVKVWGAHTKDDLDQISKAMYEEIVFWKKNLFKLPSGAAGKQFIVEMTRLITIWVEDQPLCDVVLKLLMVMPAILLQKPTRKSTAKQHTQYLKNRLDKWHAGKFDELMLETRTIQERIRNEPKPENQESQSKTFAKFMMQGKVHQALKILDKIETVGVLDATEETLNILKDLLLLLLIVFYYNAR